MSDSTATVSRPAIELPSRALLPNGTPNPDYDMTLDPGSDSFMPAKYFALRPQVEIFVKPDPDNPRIEAVPIRIASHALILEVNAWHTVPVDHAEELVRRGTAVMKEEQRRAPSGRKLRY